MANGREVGEPGLEGEFKRIVTDKIAETAASKLKQENEVARLIQNSVEERISYEARARLGTLAAVAPLDVRLLPTMQTAKPQAPEDLITEELQELIDHPPTLTGQATANTDGRRVPIVLAVVHDPGHETRPGIVVMLFNDDDVLLDRTSTNRAGLALLRFPLRSENEPARGTLRIGGAGETVSVTVPADVQYVLTDIEIPDFPEVTEGARPEDLLGDDPLSRLPSDFTPDLADAIARIQGAVPDPILGKVAEAGDFRGRRMPLIKRMTVPRLGKIADGRAPRRYLVRVRQEWIFLGYTLGELARVDALDPGEVVSQITSTIERVRETSSRAVDEISAITEALTRSAMSQLSTIDSVIEVATKAQTSVTASGFGSLGVQGSLGGGLLGGALGAVLGPVGGLVGGLFGGASGSLGVGGEIGARTGTSALASTTTSTDTITSLQVNSLLQTATSSINRALKTATATLQDATRRVESTVDKVSPLLSRVTNLLRWTMYENYAVKTHVEDVLEIRAVPITAVRPDPSMPVFSDEDIVEYRRYFEPALLEPRLRPHFDLLARAVAERVSGGRPVSVVNFAVDYSASVFSADLRINVGSSEVRLRLEPGGTTARGSLFIAPVKPDELGDIELALNARTPNIGALPSWWRDVIDQMLDRGAVTVSRLRLWFDGSTATAPHQTEWLGESLKVINDAPSATYSFDLRPPRQTTDTTTDPLFRHVNRNATYYFGVLAEAALAVPALRDDAPELADFGGDHAIWRLPIVGFEGNRALVISDPAEDDEDAAGLLDDEGAATLLQIAAPGAYAEALQGLLSLDIAQGMLHPALLPPQPPVMPPLAVVDLAGRAINLTE